MTLRSCLSSCLCVVSMSPALAWADEPAASEDHDSPRWTLQIDPLTTYLGYVHLQVEYAVTDHVSVYAGPHARLFSPPGLDREDYIGLGAEVGVRAFPWGSAPQGAWVQARAVAARLMEGDDSAFGGYISGLVGYTWVLGDAFVLSGGAGAQYIHYTINGLGPQGVFPALHTALGVAF